MKFAILSLALVGCSAILPIAGYQVNYNVTCREELPSQSHIILSKDTYVSLFFHMGTSQDKVLVVSGPYKNKVFYCPSPAIEEVPYKHRQVRSRKVDL